MNEQDRAEDPFNPDYWGADPHRDDSGNAELWFLLGVAGVAGVVVLLAIAAGLVYVAMTSRVAA